MSRAIDRAIFKILYRLKARDEETTGDGGEGSGNHGHKGRPGLRGGSAPSGAGETLEEGVYGSAPEETDLSELFADLWDNPEKPDTSENERKQKEREQEERRAYGQNGLTENEYPKNLRLTEEERNTVNNVLREFRENGYNSGATREVIQALSSGYPLKALEQAEETYKKRLEEAEEMIKQRKAEGYSYKEQHKGETGRERKEAWWRFYNEHGEVPEGIGERGIRHWQQQRKAAENALEQLEFAKKLARRKEYAESNENYMRWRDNPNAENENYKPWAKDTISGKATVTDDLLDIEDGGPGSGNWGHRGRPGYVGGSGKGGGSHYRGGRSDMGEYFGTRHDWLNGLNGERQREVTNWLKKRGGGDIKAGEKNIMESDPIDALDLLKYMAEARKLDKNEQKYIDELSDEDRKYLEWLDEKYGEYFREDATRTDKIESVLMMAPDKEAFAYADLWSKAMGGETSGRERPPLVTENKELQLKLSEHDYANQNSRQRAIEYLQKITGVEDSLEVGEMLRKMPAKAFETADNLVYTKLALEQISYISDYADKLKEDNPLSKENLEILEKYNPRMILTEEADIALVEKIAFGKLTREERQKYLSNKYQILGGTSPLKTNNLDGQIPQQSIDALKAANVEHRPLQKSDKEQTEEEIIQKLAGGDKTRGSCLSLCWAYTINKMGYDVRDYRGGESLNNFCKGPLTVEMYDACGGSYDLLYEYDDFKAAKKLFDRIEAGKEYMVTVGSHAAIMRRNNGVLEYLEMQDKDAEKNGWRAMQTDTLKRRFGCRTSRTFAYKKMRNRAMSIDISTIKESESLKELLGYLNTAEADQKKGVGGGVK